MSLQCTSLCVQVYRNFVSTPAGELELLISEPVARASSSPPIIFAHGGFGATSVWLEWMTYFHHHYGGTTYAYSVRNHGASFPVSYLKMVHGTSLDDVAGDWIAVIQHVTTQLGNGAEPVLVGHSAGGGLTQYVLANGLVTAQGLALLGAVPHFGGIDSYWNWVKSDPFIFLRSYAVGGHPSTALSQSSLVHRGFFGPKFPDGNRDGWARVKEFMKWKAPYESMGWVMGVAGGCWSWLVGRPEWFNVGDIVKSISGWDQSTDRVCVMVGSHDRLMDLNMFRRQVDEFRSAVTQIQHVQREKPSRIVVDGVSQERCNGVRQIVVENAGHHTQNDIQCDLAAEAFPRWANQL